ncbi:hypothetical protein BKI52_41235 [marine bacterium AO1-C]|nr:hypothetical protein BKI52_41235 [marine bacterium AO1-C]
MKKRVIWRLVTLSLILGLCGYESAQAQVDQRKMSASITSATQKLNQMLGKYKERHDYNLRGYIHFNRDEDARGVYLPGYGVVFKLPRVILGIRSRRVRRNRKNGDLYISVGNRARMRLTAGQYNYRDRVYFMRSKDQDTYQYRLVNRDSVITARKKVIKEAMQQFLAQATDIMNQLPDNERIDLIHNYPNRYNSYYYNNQSKSKLQMPDQITASITKKAWQRNKNKAKISETQTKQKDPNFQVMSGVFKGLYRRSVSKSFCSYSDVAYYPLGKYGVLYNLDFIDRVNISSEERYLQIREGKVIDSDSIRARQSGNYEAIKAERQKENQKAYQVFEQEIKQHIIAYGKLIKGLGANQTLALRITMPKHWYTTDDSNVPKNVLITVKGDVLQGLKSGKLSEENAKSQVKLIKY